MNNCAKRSHISLLTVHICKNAKNMITLMSAYAVFWDLLDQLEIYKDGNLDFSTVCEYMGADRSRLDALLLEETGLSGQEILSAFKVLDNYRNYD